MEAVAGPEWSSDVGQAGWIRERLEPFDAHVVTSVVPAGFQGYARVLHPASVPARGVRVVRWAAVAAWSGMPLDRDAQFHSVALPPVRPAGQAPWAGQGPREGSLHPPDAAVLAALLRPWTSTPGQCWFCLWDGYGWEGEAVPAQVRQGPRVHLPERDYLLYRGPVESVTAGLAGTGQTANLWWPHDRAWCVASEIDLPWTCVAGPAGLIESLVADVRIEALPAAPRDPLTRVEDWVTGWAQQGTAELLAAGEVTVATPRGTVRAWLTRPTRLSEGALRTQSTGDNGGTGSSWRPLGHRGEQELRSDVQDYLTRALIGLADG